MPEKDDSEEKGKSLLSRAHGLAWSNWKRKTASISIILSAVAVASGAVVKMAEAWTIMEPRLPVTYGTFQAMLLERDKEFHILVSEHEKKDKEATSKVDRGVLELKLDLAKGKRDAARDNVYKWQDKLDEATDAEKKALYRDRVREFTDTKSELEAQIKTLTKMRGSDQ